MQKTKIEINDTFNSEGEGNGVELKINDVLVMTYPNYYLQVHPMDELLTVFNHAAKCVVAEFPADFDPNKFDFNTNYQF